MKCLYPRTVVCGCAAGAILRDCIREALEIAAREDRRVEFTHNGKLYVIDDIKIINSVMEQHSCI